MLAAKGTPSEERQSSGPISVKESKILNFQTIAAFSKVRAANQGK